MTITPVTEENLPLAGAVHSAAWQASHGAFCSPEFVARHTPQAQTDYLRREMAAGKALYMLTDGEAKGIVTVQGSLIENLYVLPSAQRKGYSRELLRFAMERCDGTPTLWVLGNNPARALYQRHGFTETGRRKQLNDSLYEIEMSLRGE